MFEREGENPQVEAYRRYFLKLKMDEILGTSTEIDLWKKNHIDVR